MKKTIKSLLGLCLAFCMVLSMCACSSETEDGKIDVAKDDNGATAGAIGEIVSADQSEEANENATGAEEDNGATAEPVEEIISVDKTVVDNSECFIKITKITIRDIYECVMEVEYENRTNSNLMCELQKASINGIARELGSISMGGKETGTKEFRVGSSTFAENEVGKYTDIAMTFWVYYMTVDSPVTTIATESVHIYPYGEENATQYVREPQQNDQVLVDNEKVTVIVTGYDRSDDRWFAVNFYIVNKTDKVIVFKFDDETVNGIEANLGGGTLVTMRSVEPGQCYFATLSWQNSKLAEKGIEEIEEITFTMRVTDNDPYSVEELVNDTFTLNP